MILSWYNYKQELERNISGAATETWKKFYEDPDINLPKLFYDNLTILFDNHFSYLSSFVFQFPYYHCDYYANSSKYLKYFRNEMKADYSWFKNQGVKEEYYWGLGAGSQPDGYGANSINNNRYLVISPHIVAGALGLVDRAKDDFLQMLKDEKFHYVLPNSSGAKII